MRTLAVEPLESFAFEAFGWVLGTACPAAPTATAYRSPGSDFWHQHDFDPGEGGATEVLWVDYRNNRRQVHALEAHWLTPVSYTHLDADRAQLVQIREVVLKKWAARCSAQCVNDFNGTVGKLLKVTASK